MKASVICRYVGKAFWLGEDRESIHAETVDAEIEPEVQGIIEDGLSVRSIIPVEVWLEVVEQSEIVLASAVIKMPGTATICYLASYSEALAFRWEGSSAPSRSICRAGCCFCCLRWSRTICVCHSCG